MKKFDFTFNGHTITFEFLSDDNIWVNATEMAKVYGKHINDFLKTKESKNLIKILEKRIDINTKSHHKNEYIRFCDDNNSNKIYFTLQNFGTFMHRKLAIEFAGWLDIEFKLWMIDTIEDIVFKEVGVIKQSVEQSALRKTQIKKLETELMQNEQYRTLLKLQADERKASRERKNYLSDKDPKFNI